MSRFLEDLSSLRSIYETVVTAEEGSDLYHVLEGVEGRHFMPEVCENCYLRHDFDKPYIDGVLVGEICCDNSFRGVTKEEASIKFARYGFYDLGLSDSSVDMKRALNDKLKGLAFEIYEERVRESNKELNESEEKRLREKDWYVAQGLVVWTVLRHNGMPI